MFTSFATLKPVLRDLGIQESLCETNPTRQNVFQILGEPSTLDWSLTLKLIEWG